MTVYLRRPSRIRIGKDIFGDNLINHFNYMLTLEFTCGVFILLILTAERTSSLEGDCLTNHDVLKINITAKGNLNRNAAASQAYAEVSMCTLYMCK